MLLSFRLWVRSRSHPAAGDAIESQVPQLYDREVVVVDSGSDDGTIAIAWDFGCRIVRKLARCTCGRIPAHIIIMNL
jgi:hypothetical protein